MKVNRKVSDLARKLDYIGINLKDRRMMIKSCLNPLDKLLGINRLIKDIDKTYERLRIGDQELEKLKLKYKKNKIELFNVVYNFPEIRY